MTDLLNRQAVEFTLRADFDDIPVRGNAMASGDDAADKQYEDEILERLDRGDVWAWACVVVEARLPDLPLVGRDSLGACCYKDEKDFKRGGYYDDMCEQAHQELENLVREALETATSIKTTKGRTK
jgi:hypothetical protein